MARTRVLCFALAHLACHLCLPMACISQKVDVFSCQGLWAALANPGVTHILAMQAGSFNCSSGSLGPIELKGREVLLEGQGPGLVYIDFNRDSGHVFVAGGGRLVVRNLWIDDCLQTEMPAICFVTTLESGWLELRDMRLSDAACLRARHSAAIKEVTENLMGYSSIMQLTQVPAEEGEARGRAGRRRAVDERTVLIPDTGWLSGAVKDSHWRVLNTALMCTGNDTHPLPEDFVDVEELRLPPFFLAASLTALFALAAALVWLRHSRATSANLPEYRIAASRGFALEEPLGKGHYGRVYRGRQTSTGQLVAVKVIDLLPSQRRRMLAAYRECQLMSSVRHECIVRVVTFYTARVHKRQHTVESISDSDTMELEDPAQQAQQGGPTGGESERSGPAAPPAAVHDSSSSSPGPRWGAALKSSGGHSGSGYGSSSTGGSEGRAGVLIIQVQLVTQFCDMGTLEQAVKKGWFRDGATRDPILRHILATALEIARGLEYMQQPERRLVHRDLSANNVLLMSSAGDDRGFRALISDFGLSTVLAAEQTHKTSQVKGTISYMPPEVFIRDDISPALDVYSLGVIMHLMFSGRDPFAGMTPAMTILAKVREHACLPQLEGAPAPLQELVWDCTAANRRDRPTAAQAVQRLEALLMSC